MEGGKDIWAEGAVFAKACSRRRLVGAAACGEMSDGRGGWGGGGAWVAAEGAERPWEQLIPGFVSQD